jgi:hypothetical protein
MMVHERRVPLMRDPPQDVVVSANNNCTNTTGFICNERLELSVAGLISEGASPSRERPQQIGTALVATWTRGYHFWPCSQTSV